MKTRRGSSSSAEASLPSLRRRVRLKKPDLIEDPIDDEASEDVDDADNVDEAVSEIEHPVEQVAPILDQIEVGDSKQVNDSSSNL